jgi:hypothetical protein
MNSDKTGSKVVGIERLYSPTGEKYLTRYVLIRTRWFALYLHRLHAPDPDRDLHNHPWRATSLILWGGYTELVTHTRAPDPETRLTLAERMHLTGDLNRIRTSAYHRIVKVEPNTWTLVFAGRRFRRWGFLENGVHVDSDEYLRRE